MADATQVERWAPIPGSPGYEVSDFGRVRSVDRIVKCVDGKRQHRKGRLIAPSASGKHLMVRIGYRGKFVMLHPLVLEAFVGPRPEGMDALHWNDDARDNRLSNLRWATPSDNMYDRVRNGRHKQANQTVCSRGHRLVPPNIVPSGRKPGAVIKRRGCLACNRANGLRYSRMRSGLHVPPDLQVLADAYYAEIMRDEAC